MNPDGERNPLSMRTEEFAVISVVLLPLAVDDGSIIKLIENAILV